MGLSSQSGDVAESLSLCCQGEREVGAAAGALAEVWFKGMCL